MAGVAEVEVVVAHHDCATLRVGDVFLKIDADQARTDVEVEAMAMAPIPTPEVLWRKPPVLALAALPGTALGRLGEPSTASPAAWAAAGAAVRMLHDAPLPPWPGRSPGEFAAQLDGECEWLIVNGVLSDLARLTLGHEEHLADVIAGYGTDVDLDVIRAWWSLRSLLAIRWLVEHGFDPARPGCEVDVLRARL